MATMLREPPVRLPDVPAHTHRASAPAQPAATLAPDRERFSLHDGAVAILLACGEWGALAHGALWYALLHGLWRRELT